MLSRSSLEVHHGINSVSKRLGASAWCTAAVVLYAGMALAWVVWRWRGIAAGIDGRHKHSHGGGHGARTSVVFFLVDDQGYNDFGPESSDLWWATPTLSKLASEGIVLHRYYAMHLCTPSRAALLSGLHPVRLGCQHSMLTGNEPWGLDTGVALLPQMLRSAGYATALAGKWHLGHCAQSMWPTRRGFDEFVGFFSGFQDYYTHVAETSLCGDWCRRDWRRGNSPVAEKGYSLDLLADFAVEFVARRRDEPFLLVFSSPSVHEPLELPPALPAWWTERHETLLAEIPSKRRRVFATMTVVTDDAARRLVEAVDLDNVLWCYASDNGGAALWPNVGNNYPLRGTKGFYFEGGVRVRAFLRPPASLVGSSHGKFVYRGLYSVLDWLPTILSALSLPDLRRDPTDLDGVDHWLALSRNNTPPRTELLVNVDALDARVCDISQFDTVAVNPCWICTGALIVNSTLKLIRNAQPMPAWHTPAGDYISTVSNHSEDNITAPYFNWTASPRGDFVFDLATDPTESVNLEDPDIRRPLLARFDYLARTFAVKPAFCGEQCNEQASRTLDGVPGFVGAWLPEEPQPSACDAAKQVPAYQELLLDEDAMRTCLEGYA